MYQMTELQKKIQGAMPDLLLKMEEPLCNHTSFKIGGPAEVMAFPSTVEELQKLLRWAKAEGIVPVVLGAGTNVLAPDEGLRGLIVCTKGALMGLTQEDDTTVTVMSGVSMARAAGFAADLGLSGLEFAHGIPGSVGGGLYMNAGAYGGEMKQVAEKTVFMDLEGNLHVAEGEQQDFSYRHSAFTGKPGVIVSGTFRLTPKPAEEIWDTMRVLMGKRKASQPLDMPSAGSTFKRPVGGYAAALIEQAGLKGFQVGGAAVSQKHAGFVVNLGGATREDVLNLIEKIQERVLQSSGISLEPEVIRL